MHEDAGALQPSISVCVCTYRRPVQLAALIQRLAIQEGEPGIRELIVIDNDAAGSARPVVESAPLPFPLRYEVQPVKNISLARNRSVELARSDWVCFIDDDEVPQVNWLSKLYAAAVRFGADGVMGPVMPVLPDTAPMWIRRGNFFARPRHATGTPVPDNELRTGNALVAARWLRHFEGPFNPSYGLTGGGDSDLLRRLAEAGAKFVWCDEAPVHEAVAHERLRLGWLLQRAYRGGQGWARFAHANSYRGLGRFGGYGFVAHAVAAMMAGLVMALVSLPRGRACWARWLGKACGQAGKLMALVGHRYNEYR